MIVYVGCSTDKDHPNGLRAVEVDAATGALVERAAYAVDNPLYLALAPDGKTLYSNWADGLASFRVDGAKATEIDRLSLKGRAMCHVSLSPDATRAYWVAYSNAKAGCVEVKDGKFGKVTAYEHHGKGPNLPRQGSAHCHQATPLPDGRGFVVCDLGLDALVSYWPDEPGRSQIFATTPAGAGPRHMVFHPNGRLAFVLFELGNLVASYAWDPVKGFGPMLDERPTLDPWPSGRPYNGDLAAAIRFTPDGKRLVVSNRGEQTLVTFDYDEKSGKMSFRGRTKLPGSWPRDFLFLDDTLAIVAQERSDDVVTLRYRPETGTFDILHALGGFFRPLALAKVR